MERIHRIGLALAVLLCSAAAGGLGQLEYKSYPVSAAPPELRAAIERGDLVVASLQNSFVSELTRELRRGGAVGAIKSCHLDATNAAFAAARQKGIAAGRTGDRLRNPTNAPKTWAAPIVARYAGRQASEIEGVVVDLGTHIGLMRPLAHQGSCDTCHGREEKLDPRIRAELKERYPADRALGFRKGEIRGWYWVEVPK